MRIVIVDDTPVNLKLMESLVKRANAEKDWGILRGSTSQLLDVAANGHICKPIRFEALKLAIEAAVNRPIPASEAT